MKKKYDRSYLASEIKKMIRKDKLYRDMNFSRTELSNRLGIPPALVSEVFREIIGCSFPDFVNGCRVEYAHSLLSSAKYRGLSIEDVSVLAGFKCRMNMYRFYQKRYGETPAKTRALNN